MRSEDIRRYFNMYISTSPSYLLMASAERCMDFLDSGGTAAFEKYVELLGRFWSECKTLRHLYLWKHDGAFDNGKLVICTDRSSLSGPELAGILRNRYGLEPELVSAEYVLAMTSCMDGAECYERLFSALREIDSECTAAAESKRAAGLFEGACAVKYCEAWETEGMEYTELPLGEAVGGVSADYVYVYPPGVPWIVPGEKITEPSVRRIEEYLSRSIEVRGLAKDGRIKIFPALQK